MALKREFIEPEADGDRLGYLDGFRFGLGFFVAGTLVAAVVCGVVAVALSLAGR